MEEKAHDVVSTEQADNTLENATDKEAGTDNQTPTENTGGLLKRCRTQSDQTTDDDAAEPGKSASKRKKGEVTFNIPAEESKQDENKSVPKKKAKKRKSRSRSSDEFQSDSKDEAESETNENVPEKKAKLESSNKDKTKENEQKDKTSESELNKQNKDGKKNKKRFRRKKPRVIKEIPELRVLPK